MRVSRWWYDHSSASHLLGDSLAVHRQLEVWLQQLGCNALLHHTPRMLLWILSTSVLLGSLLAYLLRAACFLQGHELYVVLEVVCTHMHLALQNAQHTHLLSTAGSMPFLQPLDALLGSLELSWILLHRKHHAAVCLQRSNTMLKAQPERLLRTHSLAGHTALIGPAHECIKLREPDH